MPLPFFKKKGKTREQVEVETGDVKAEDIVAPSLIEVKQNHLKMGERICKTFFDREAIIDCGNGARQRGEGKKTPLTPALWAPPLLQSKRGGVLAECR